MQRNTSLFFNTSLSDQALLSFRKSFIKGISTQLQHTSSEYKKALAFAHQNPECVTELPPGYSKAIIDLLHTTITSHQAMLDRLKHTKDISHIREVHDAFISSLWDLYTGIYYASDYHDNVIAHIKSLQGIPDSLKDDYIIEYINPIKNIKLNLPLIYTRLNLLYKKPSDTILALESMANAPNTYNRYISIILAEQQDFADKVNACVDKIYPWKLREPISYDEVTTMNDNSRARSMK